MTKMATETLQQLVELGLIIQTRPKSSQNSDGQDIHILEVTPLGRAVFKGKDVPNCCDLSSILFDRVLIKLT